MHHQTSTQFASIVYMLPPLKLWSEQLINVILYIWKLEFWTGVILQGYYIKLNPERKIGPLYFRTSGSRLKWAKFSAAARGCLFYLFYVFWLSYIFVVRKYLMWLLMIYLTSVLNRAMHNCVGFWTVCK